MSRFLYALLVAVALFVPALHRSVEAAPRYGNNRTRVVKLINERRAAAGRRPLAVDL